MKKNADAAEREALDLIEEAVRLLRVRPALLLPYYIGTIPFIVGLLFFWSDMSRGAQAHARIAGASFGMSLLFAWMKAWQTSFARACRDELGLAPGEPVSLGGWLRTATLQLPVQALGFFLLPASFIVAIPFGWVYAFFQNYTLTGAGGATLREAVRGARDQAMRWPGQNHRFLAIIFVFGLFVFLNVAILTAVLPSLLKIFIGADTEFTRSRYSMQNTTFVFVAAALAHLAVDPLVKTFYVIRCYLGDSLATGEDILSGLRTLPPPARRLGALTMMLFFLLAAPRLSSQPETGATAAPAFTLDEFDASADSVLERREFAWRLPREKAPEKRGIIDEFVTGVINGIVRWTGDAFKLVWKWLEALFSSWKFDPDLSGPVSATSQVLRVLLYGFLVTAALILLIFLIRVWRRRPVAAVAIAPPPKPSAPDLTEDQVDASQLQVSEWLSLAHDLMRDGKPRLALRALYLASLAGLAEREWIRTAKHKSNMDYRNELERRAHGTPELTETFARHVGDFECVWYGNHEIAAEGLCAFEQDYERILALASR